MMNDLVVTTLLELDKTYLSCDKSLDHDILSKLWTKYYFLTFKYHDDFSLGYPLYLLSENKSYFVYQEPKRKVIDKDKFQEVINHVIKIRNGAFEGLSLEEITLLLDFSLENARRGFELLGLDLKKSSLNGFCEMGQFLSLDPLEKLGFKVTKNRANQFNYPFNHCFGTVSFPYQDEDKVVLKTYLIDSTYRQFFTTNRCNYGRYYHIFEDEKILAGPDPGYFVKDLSFARKLMGDGYIELTTQTAFMYGDAFYKSGLDLISFLESKESGIDYYDTIINSSLEYKNSSDLDNLNLGTIDIKNILEKRQK